MKHDVTAERSGHLHLKNEFSIAALEDGLEPLWQQVSYGQVQSQWTGQSDWLDDGRLILPAEWDSLRLGFLRRFIANDSLEE